MTLPPDPTSAPETYTLDADTPCLSCGFNLRGLNTDGICPECGSAVGLSLAGYCLRANGPDYIGTLIEGLRWWRLGVATNLVGVAAFFVVPPSPVPNRSLVLTVGLLSAVACLFYAVGGWIETAPTAASLGASTYSKLRAVIRYGVLAGILSAMLQLRSAANEPESRFPWIMIALYAARFAAHIGFLFYLVLLASEIPRPTLAKYTRGLAILLAIWFALGIVAPAYFWMARASAQMQHSPLFNLVLLIFRGNSVINLVWHLLELWVLWRFFKAFRIERDLAIEEYESSLGPPSEELPPA